MQNPPDRRGHGRQLSGYVYGPYQYQFVLILQLVRERLDHAGPDEAASRDAPFHADPPVR
jgi:hypothetical protein